MNRRGGRFARDRVSCQSPETNTGASSRVTEISLSATAENRSGCTFQHSGTESVARHRITSLSPWRAHPSEHRNTGSDPPRNGPQCARVNIGHPKRPGSAVCSSSRKSRRCSRLIVNSPLLPGDHRPCDQYALRSSESDPGRSRQGCIGAPVTIASRRGLNAEPRVQYSLT